VPGATAGCWQVTFVPSHWSTVQTLLSDVHAVPEGFFASVGQLADVPVHASAWSHSPFAVRQTVPALPAGCWHVTFVPSQISRVQTLPSSVHDVPFVFFASVGQVADVPVQFSATSHSPVAARQVEPALPGGCWHVVLTPSQWSVVQGFPSSVQAVPLLPAACWQVVLLPLHRSVVQGLPSSGHAVPLFPAAC
jgi:hypothetical protein